MSKVMPIDFCSIRKLSGNPNIVLKHTVLVTRKYQKLVVARIVKAPQRLLRKKNHKKQQHRQLELGTWQECNNNHNNKNKKKILKK